MAIITGSSSSETLNGTALGDEINGLGGNDVINAGDGNDTINGGSGSDTIDGGAGDDLMLSESGAEWYVASATNNGHDTIDGYDQWTDHIDASAITETIYIDVVDSSTMILWWDGGNSSITLTNTVDNASNWSDKMLFGGTYTGATAGTFTPPAVGNGVWEGTNGIDHPNLGDVDADGDVLGVTTNVVELGDANDSMAGDYTMGMYIDGGAGDDALVGHAYDDTIIGGTGNDWISFGQNEDDSGSGPSGVDTLIIRAGDGHDQIDDFWFGQDTLIADFVNPADVVITDNRVYEEDRGWNGSLVVTWGDPNQSLTFTDTNWDPSMPVTWDILTNPSSVNVYEEGGFPHSTGELIAPGSTDFDGTQIDGADGNDDIIHSEWGNDTVSAGEGNDFIADGIGNDIYGGGSVTAADYDGDDGADTFSFVYDTSQFNGVDHDTIVNFEYGKDTLILAGWAEADVTITDTRAPGFAGDVILSFSNTARTITLQNVLGDGAITFDGLTSPTGMLGSWTGGSGTENHIDGGSAGDLMDIGFWDAEGNIIDGADGDHDVIHGHDGNDTIYAGEGDDIVYGDADNDEIHGGNGFDDLQGGAGDDSLFGDADADFMLGGAGADYMDGGTGDDVMNLSDFTMTGDGARDVVVASTTSDRDTVLNFEYGIDVIDFQGVAEGDMSIDYTDFGTGTWQVEIVWGTNSIYIPDLIGYDGTSVIDYATLTGQGTPNLYIDALTANDTSLAVGQDLTVNLSIGNDGTGDAPASETNYYWSADGTFGNGDEVLLGIDAHGALTSGQTDTSQGATFSYDQLVGLGDGFIFAAIDPTNDVVESNEADNVSAALAVTFETTTGSVADLYYDTTWLDDSTLTDGQDVKIWMHVGNSGTADAVGESTIYWSADNVFDASDIAIDADGHGTLNPGELDTNERERIRFEDLEELGQSGYIFAVLDDASIIAESDEGNNVSVGHYYEIV